MHCIILKNAKSGQGAEWGGGAQTVVNDEPQTANTNVTHAHRRTHSLNVSISLARFRMILNSRWHVEQCLSHKMLVFIEMGILSI